MKKVETLDEETVRLIDSLENGLPVSESDASRWEKDAWRLCDKVREMGKRIETGRLLAIEIAAHSECHCENGEGDCAYCLAVKLTEPLTPHPLKI